MTIEHMTPIEEVLLGALLVAGGAVFFPFYKTMVGVEVYQ